MFSNQIINLGGNKLYKLLLAGLLIHQGQSADVVDSSGIIKVYFYPGNTTNQRVILNETLSDSLTETGISARDQVKLIIHGVNSSCAAGSARTIISGYLQANYEGLGNNNVFCVDYGPLVTTWKILRRPRELPEITSDVGKRVFPRVLNLFTELMRINVIRSFEEIHIIGHSMGAQVAGIVGWNIQLEMGSFRKIGRISGLDPGKTVEVLDLDNQLDLSDAMFVDIIHTNEGLLGFGLAGKYGHVDFYPDGGSAQVVCQIKETVLRRILGGITCSHTVVAKYWKESVLNPYNPVVACEAESWKIYEKTQKMGECRFPEVIGEYTSTSARGKYFVKIERNYVTV